MEETSSTASTPDKTIKEVRNESYFESDEIGSLYKEKLVDIENIENKNWWKWSYENKFQKNQDKLQTLISTISNAFNEKLA